MTTAKALIDELPDDTAVIPMPVVREIINEHLGPWDYGQQSYAVRSGVIRTIPGRVGRGHAYAVHRDEAMLILIAALLAFAAGVAVVSMIRALRISGVNPAAFVKANKP